MWRKYGAREGRGEREGSGAREREGGGGARDGQRTQRTMLKTRLASPCGPMPSIG